MYNIICAYTYMCNTIYFKTEEEEEKSGVSVFMCISGRKNSLCMKFLRLKRVKNWKQSSGTGEWRTTSVQFSSVTQSCMTLCDPMNHSTPGLPVRHQLLEFTQTYIHWVGDAIQPSHPLSSASPRAFNLSQHQHLFQWVSSSHQVAKVLEFQLQCQSF